MTKRTKRKARPNGEDKSGSPREESPDIPIWLAATTFGAITVFLFRDFIFSDDMLVGGDTLSLGYAARAFFADALRELGRVPGWAPDILGGVPFLESLSGGDALYPPSLFLLATMETYRSLGWKLILHVFVAGLAMFGWLRSLGVSRSGAWVGATGFMVAPYFVSLVAPGHDGKMFVTALTPLLFWAVERHFQNPRLRTISAISLVVGLVILTTHMQMAYFLFGATGMYAAFRAWRVAREAPEESPSISGRKAGSMRFALFLGASVAGAGIAAVQLVPTVDYVLQDSRRVSTTRTVQGETSKEWAASWSMHAEEAMSLIVPEFPGATGGDAPWAGDSYWGRNGFKLNSEYVGLVLLILAALSFGVRRVQPRQWFFLGLGGLAFAYALGANTPVWHLLYGRLPGVSLFRAASQVIFLTGFSVATLAAFGVDHLIRAHAQGVDLRKTRGILIGSLSVVGVIAALIGSGLIVPLWTSTVYSDISPGRLATLEGYLPFLAQGAAIAVLLAGSAAAIAWATVQGRLPGRLAVIGLVLLVSVDGMRIDAPFIRTIDYEGWHAPHPLLASIEEREVGQDEPFRLFSLIDGGQDVAPAMHGVELVAGHHPNDLNRYRELIGMVGSAQPVNLLAANPSIRQILNVRYILWPDAEYGEPPAFPIVQRVQYSNGRVHSTLLADNGLPRARLVGRAVVQSDENAVAYMLSPAFDAANEVVLPEAPPIELSGAPPTGSVRWLDRVADRQTLSVTTDQPALLVIADNYYPGWQAEVNGASAPVLRANHALRAVPVPAGEHTVSLQYRSESVVRSFWISILCTLLVLGIGAFELVRGRRVEGSVS